MKFFIVGIFLGCSFVGIIAILNIACEVIKSLFRRAVMAVAAMKDGWIDDLLLENRKMELRIEAMERFKDEQNGELVRLREENKVLKGKVRR